MVLIKSSYVYVKFKVIGLYKILMMNWNIICFGEMYLIKVCRLKYLESYSCV